jgi:hypothetical protein
VKDIVADIKPGAPFLMDDVYLQPVVADDPLLFELDDFDDDDEEFEAGGHVEDAGEMSEEEGEDDEDDDDDDCPDLDEEEEEAKEEEEKGGSIDSSAATELGGLEKQNAVLRRQLGTVKAKLDKVMGVMGAVVADYDRTCGSCGQRQGASSDVDYMLDFLVEVAAQSPAALEGLGIARGKHSRGALLEAIKRRTNGAAHHLEGSSGTGSARPLAVD